MSAATELVDNKYLPGFYYSPGKIIHLNHPGNNKEV